MQNGGNSKANVLSCIIQRISSTKQYEKLNKHRWIGPIMAQLQTANKPLTKTLTSVIIIQRHSSRNRHRERQKEILNPLAKTSVPKNPHMSVFLSKIPEQ